MPIPSNYTCDGQINLEEVLNFMYAPKTNVKPMCEVIQAYEAYGIKNKQIQGQRTWLHYNPSPYHRLNNGPYIIFANIAYLSETTVYAKEFRCYPVLHEFATVREAESFYRAFVREITKAEKEYPKVIYQEINTPLDFEEMYRIDGVWRAESWKREHKYHS